MSWQREDGVYAAAALAAAALVVYFTIGNFGLVPSPLAPGRADTGRAIGVPSIGTLAAAPAGSATATPAVPRFVSPPAVGGAPATTRTAPRDITRPGGTITTEPGTQFSLTAPSTVDGTASDRGSGVGAVRVTFAPAAGGDPTVVPARLTCNGRRAQCTWSADVPAVAGRYQVTAETRDRASNASRTQPVEITVVNGGGAVKTVTDVVDGLVGGLVGVL